MLIAITAAGLAIAGWVRRLRGRRKAATGESAAPVTAPSEVAADNGPG